MARHIPDCKYIEINSATAGIIQRVLLDNGFVWRSGTTHVKRNSDALFSCNKRYIQITKHDKTKKIFGITDISNITDHDILLIKDYEHLINNDDEE